MIPLGILLRPRMSMQVVRITSFLSITYPGMLELAGHFREEYWREEYCGRSRDMVAGFDVNDAEAAWLRCL